MAKKVQKTLNTINHGEVESENIHSEDTVSIFGDFESTYSSQYSESPFSDLMIGVALYLDGKPDEKGIFDFIKKVFSIPEEEHEVALEETRIKLDSQKFDSIQEYSKLMVKFANDRLASSGVEPFSWDGSLHSPASDVLMSQALHKNMSTSDVSVAKWIALSEIQSEVDLDPLLFHQLIQVITEPSKEFGGKICLKSTNRELSRMFDKTFDTFWISTLRFFSSLPSFEDSDVKSTASKFENFVIVMNNLNKFTVDGGSERIKSDQIEHAITNSFETGVYKHLQSLKKARNESESRDETLSGINDFVTIAHDKFQGLLKAYQELFKK